MKLIVFSGLPGTGKTTLATALSKELGLEVFSVDEIESRIIQTTGTPRSYQTGLQAYKDAAADAARQLEQGRSVIVDAVNAVDEAKQMWIEFSNQYDASLKVIECICSDYAIHKHRIDERERNIHGIPETTWEEVLIKSKESTPWTIPTIIIDCINDTALNIPLLLKFTQ